MELSIPYPGKSLLNYIKYLVMSDSLLIQPLPHFLKRPHSNFTQVSLRTMIQQRLIKLTIEINDFPGS